MASETETLGWAVSGFRVPGFYSFTASGLRDLGFGALSLGFRAQSLGFVSEVEGPGLGFPLQQIWSSCRVRIC